MSVLVAAPASGAGKTTVTLAIAAWLAERGITARAFKVGPDYLDPMFHARVLGRPCINLDPFLTDEDFVGRTFRHHCRGMAAAVIEGAMGLFDGRIGEADFASSAHVARLLGVPVVLVVDAQRTGWSLAALLHGFQSFDPRLDFAGVILNRVGSERHCALLTEAVASQGLPVLGAIPRTDAVHLESRHLGLIAAGEVEGFAEIAARLAGIADRHLDWERLLPLLAPEADDGAERWPGIAPVGGVRLGLARDRAFNFYYQDNLDLLATLGAELVAFSPLADEWPACDGYLLGGGYPELFAAELADAHGFQAGVHAAHAAGLPLYAECGGLMALCRTLTGLDGQTWPMAGLIPAHCRMGARTVLGYREATTLAPSCAVVAGGRVRGHEFHRSSVEPGPERPLFCLAAQGNEGWSLGSLHASYLHLHWGAQVESARRLVARATLASALG